MVPADLHTKHDRMRASAFSFMRGTFYRFAQIFPLLCPDLASARPVLAVGDLHIENFGSWRDVEGRLIWGCNDFDEAFELPYTLDLVRLAASARLAAHEGVVTIDPDAACDAILAGYHDGVKAGPHPFVLAESTAWLRRLVMSDLREPKAFAEKLLALPPPDYKVPAKALQALTRSFPQKDLGFEYRHRVAGMGSLGRQRIVAIADWYGGVVVRETKPLCASAVLWARDEPDAAPRAFDIIARARRCPDPFTSLSGKWIVRRLSPDASSIDISRLDIGMEAKLLHAMGRETANIHLGSAQKALLKDLNARPEGWLRHAAKTLALATIEDWKTFKAK